MRTLLLLLCIAITQTLQSQITFSESSGIGNSNSWSSEITDIDGDNDLDVLVYNNHYQIAQENKIWINNGAGEFTEGDNSLIKSGFYLCDFNNDGIIDIVAKDSVFINDGSSNFTEKYPFMDLTKGSFFFEHLNNDTLIDVIILKQATNNSEIQLYIQNTPHNFQSSWDTVFSCWINTVSFYDLNLDNLTDVVLSISDGANRILYNNNNSFKLSTQQLGNSNSVKALFADFDNDGDIDLYFSNLHLSSDFSIKLADQVWLNDGAGEFSKGYTFPKIINMGAVAFDFDYDGDIDIFTASSESGKNKLWLNDGNANFSDGNIKGGSYQTGGVSIGDLDNDGDMDLFLSCFNMSSAQAPNHILWNKSIIDRLLYLNQTVPGNIPELFSPDIISVDDKNTHALNFHPEERALIFSRFPEGKSYIMYLHDSTWTQPELVPFEGKEVCFSADGKYVYYYNIDEIYRYPYPFSDTVQPEKLSSIVNSDEAEYYPYITSNNNLYFSRNTSWNKAKIYFSEYVNDSWQEAVGLDSKINTGGASHAYISPEEDYILFNSPSEGSYTDNDIWVSFKTEEGTWTNPVNVGETINSEAGALLCPTVSPDGKYLFFTRFTNGLGKVYWVSTSFIDDLREQATFINSKKKETSTIKIFPNPSNDFITITNTSLNNDNIKYELIDMNGRTIKSGQTNLNRISLSGLQPGCYHLKYELDDEVFNGKIIKQ